MCATSIGSKRGAGGSTAPARVVGISPGAERLRKLNPFVQIGHQGHRNQILQALAVRSDPVAEGGTGALEAAAG
jgi:hypothetical protein